MKQELGKEFPAFLESLHAPPPVSIRLNPAKKPEAFAGTEQVPWNPGGRYLPERPVFTLDPLFHGGAYYVQEASSMFLDEALRQTVELRKKLRVLDLCAAPGGKCTLLVSAINGESLVVANEAIQSRVGALRMNLEKWGYPNIAAANHDNSDFKGLENFFDIVAVDAPCSGEGLFRKDESAVEEWSEQNVQLCAGRQRRILAEAMPLVRPGGVLIYSTCTFNHFENGNNVRWMLETGDFDLINLITPKEWGIVEKEYGYQFYPHLVRGEGFFLTCLRKKPLDGPSAKFKSADFKDWQQLKKQQTAPFAHWLQNPDGFSFFQKPNGEITAIPESILEDSRMVATVLRKRSIGVAIGQMKGRDFVPAHALALSTIVSKDLPSENLDLERALQYLRKEEINLTQASKGWASVRFNGINLGWIKALPNRINNYFPSEWRIRMR